MTLDESVHGMRLRVIERAQVLGNVSAVCRELGISRTVFYRWRQRLERYGSTACTHVGSAATRGGRWRHRQRWSGWCWASRSARPPGAAAGSRPTWRAPGKSAGLLMHYYNTERPHQGYRVRGRTPAALVWGVAAVQ